jgi:hypothetical protein
MHDASSVEASTHLFIAQPRSRVIELASADASQVRCRRLLSSCFCSTNTVRTDLLSFGGSHLGADQIPCALSITTSQPIEIA